LIRTVLAAGRDLDATVVAEGIETRAQARCVEVLGCHLGQGYLWAPALPLQEAEARLSLESRPV
jgi:EAL domain-containing protein (putative c-di-GMP-specific phosphodiesterase class I)